MLSFPRTTTLGDTGPARKGAWEGRRPRSCPSAPRIRNVSRDVPGQKKKKPRSRPAPSPPQQPTQRQAPTPLPSGAGAAKGHRRLRLTQLPAPILAAFSTADCIVTDPALQANKRLLPPPERSSPYPKTFHEVLHDHIAASARLLPSPGASLGKRKQPRNAALSLTAQPRLPPPAERPSPANPQAGRDAQAQAPDGRSRRRHQSSKQHRRLEGARPPSLREGIEQAR